MIGLALTAAALLAAGSAPAAGTACGEKTLYGTTYTLYAHNVPCEQVAQITSAKCDVFAEPWFCFSAHAPGPPLYWGKADEMFAEKTTAWIDTKRPPCSQSKVTRADWKRASQQRDDQFPTERQLLTDDLLRCKQLRRGMTKAAVVKLLGKTDETLGRELTWDLGPQRDSVFQIDGEFLSVVLDRRDKVRSVAIYQS